MRQVTILGLVVGLSIVAFIGSYRLLSQREVQVAVTGKVDQSRQTADDTIREVSFLAVGDILLSRHVAARIEQAGDVGLPFQQIAELLHSTDFNFGNLESPISGNDRVKGRGLIFNTATSHLDGLASSNFKIVNLANNHALDQGVKGLNNTRQVLSEKGISCVGVGDNQFDAWSPEIITAKSIRVGFLGASYASFNDGGAARNNYVARIEDRQSLRASLDQLKAVTDFIVVTMHAGVEYRRHPHPSQVAFAHAAIDYGADLVIGGHPHWIQKIEEYQGKYIFYSLGNFVFDQGHHQDTREGLVLRVSLQLQQSNEPAGVSDTVAQAQPVTRISTKLDRIELIPIIIERCVPRRASEKEAQKILRKIGIVFNVLDTNLSLGNQIIPNLPVSKASGGNDALREWLRSVLRKRNSFRGIDADRAECSSIQDSRGGDNIALGRSSARSHAGQGKCFRTDGIIERFRGRS